MYILSQQVIMWLSSVYGTRMPVCTPNKVWACPWLVSGWCPGGSPPRPGSGHHWAPGQSVMVLGGIWLTDNITSHRCSIGFRSGDWESQSMASMPSSSRNCLHTLATRVILLSMAVVFLGGWTDRPLLTCCWPEAVDEYLPPTYVAKTELMGW